MAPFSCPVLQIFWFCSPCTISSVKLTSVLFVCFWLRDKAVGTSDLRWYDDRSGADIVSAVFGSDRRLPLVCRKGGEDTVHRAACKRGSLKHPLHVSSDGRSVKYNIRCMPRLKPIYFCGHWQGTPLGAMGGLACAAIVHLVRVMRSNGRPLVFLGLSGTMLGEGEADHRAQTGPSVRTGAGPAD